MNEKNEITLLVVAVLLVLSVVVVAAAPLHLQTGSYSGVSSRRGGWYMPWRNITSHQIVIAGVIEDADFGRLVVSSDGESMNLVAVPRWMVAGSTITFFKLFSEDYLNKGDRVEVTVLILSWEEDGETLVMYVAREVRDLTTGVGATALLQARLQSAGRWISTANPISMS